MEGNKQGLYKVELDADQALEFVKHGASLLLLDVPPSTTFGIDTQMFVVGQNFKGMKMIPPGPHFIYYSAVSRDGSEASPMIGFFICPEVSEVIVKKWDLEEERIIKLEDESEEERFALAVRNLEFDRYLAPYDLKHYQDWRKISSYVSKDTLERFAPVGGEITVMSEAELTEKGPYTQAERLLMDQLSKTRTCYEQKSGSSRKILSENHRCFYTQIPHSFKQKGASVEQLTTLNLDKSQMLENLLEDKYGGNEDLMLGELQFSFIAFLMGQSLEAFGQWKAIVCLFLCCIVAPLHTRTTLFIKFLEVVYYQLRQGFKSSNNSQQVSFLDDSWFAEDNFLQVLFKEFFNLVLETSPVNGDLLSKTRKLQKLLELNLGWQMKGGQEFFVEDNEFAPVIVTEEEMVTEHVEQ